MPPQIGFRSKFGFFSPPASAIEYELPDGTIITPTHERFGAPELMFRAADGVSTASLLWVEPLTNNSILGAITPTTRIQLCYWL